MRYSRLLRQKVVYWPPGESDGKGGIDFGTPVELNGRWEDTQEIFTNASGEEEVSKSMVLVDEDVEVKGYLLLGELTDLSSVGVDDPTSEDDAWEIRAFSKTPGVRNPDEITREAVL